MPEVCKKCGGKLDPKGNYCMECLQPTYGAEAVALEEATAVKKEPPLKLIYIGLAVIFLLMVVTIYVKTRPQPPDMVVQNWVDDLVSYKISDALQYTTDRYESSNPLADGRQSSAEKADEFKDAVTNQNATYTVSKPQIRDTKPPVAVVTVTFKGETGDTFSYDALLAKQPNGRWLIDRVE